MALLVTLFLVLVNIFNTVTTNTPKAEGLTAIEAWMLSCILFVFATLVEYACLLFSRDNFVNLDENADDHDWIPETDPCRYGIWNVVSVLPPNSRPPNSLSPQIHGFISISIKLLIHGFIRKILLIHCFF